MGIGRVARLPAAVWVIGAAVVLRLAAAAAGPLIDDEAYYWLWAQRLDWGYLDHPPMIAWLIALTTTPGDAAFLIRLSPLVLGVLTSYTLFLLGREMFGVRAGLLAAVLFQIVPVLAGAGLLATPDAPLLLAWAAALRFAWQAVHGRPQRWLAFGVVLGLGMLSKLTMILLPAGVALYLLVRARQSLRRWHVYAAAALAGLAFSPVLAWNAHHGWAGVHYVLSGRLSGGAPDVTGITGVLKLLEEQIPFSLALLPAFAWALLVPVRRPGEAMTFLALTSLPAVIFPFIPAYAGTWPHGNWLAPAYLSFSVVLGAAWNRPAALLAAINGTVVLYGLSTSILPVLPLLPGAEDVYGWREAGVRVTAELRALGDGAAIAADRYQVAAQLGYHTRNAGVTRITVLPCPPAASNWARPADLAGRPAVAVVDARWTPRVRWDAHAARVEEAPPLTVEDRGRILRRFRIYRLIPLRTDARCQGP